MKRTKIIILALGALGGVWHVNCSPSRQVPTQIEFIYNLETAKLQAAGKKQPLIIEFYRPDCSWSKLLDDSTFNNQLIIEMSQEMTFAKIDAEKDSALARRHGVSYYPTIIVASANGAEIDRLVGFYPAADFFNEVQLFLQGNETLTDYLKRLADEPERADYNLIVADRYRNRSDWDKALEYYGNVLKFSRLENQGESEKAFFEIAGIQCEKGEYANAIKNYSDFIIRYPESERAEDAARRHAFCRAKNGEYKKALEEFQRYLADYPAGEYAGWVHAKIDSLNELIP